MIMFALVENGIVTACPVNPDDYIPAGLIATRPYRAALLAEYNLVRVQPVDPPEATVAQKAVEGTPAPDGDGVWWQTWVLADKTADDLAAEKEEKKAAVSARLQALFEGGFTPVSGPLSGKMLQSRDNTDRTNWLTSQAAYSAAVAAGQGATLGAHFRTAANETVTCSYADGLTTLLDMAAWGAEAMGNAWALKDAIEAAADFTALAGIDIETGWPA